MYSFVFFLLFLLTDVFTSEVPKLDYEFINDSAENIINGDVIENLRESVDSLEAQDVKCLISDDVHCSKDMLGVKETLIKAVKEDCPDCSDKQKNNAGRVMLSMMARHPEAWKMFLTIQDSLDKLFLK